MLRFYAFQAYNGAMTELEQSIVERIKKCMKTRQVTQADLADAVGVKQYTVSRMLSGLPFPSLEQLILIAKKLDVSLYYLIGLQEESYRELSPKAAKVADAYQNSIEPVQEIIERILLVD